MPGLTDEPAWPTLRAHLIDLAAETGEHPLRHLQEAADGRDLATSGDMAAVLYWRLPALPTPEAGPLPWLPGIPEKIQDHPVWANYLAKRAQHVADLAGQIRDLATRADDQPVWAPLGSHLSTALIGDIAVWRAACGIDPQDPRPTGGNQLEAAADLWKQDLDRDVARAIEPHNSNVDQRPAPRKALRHGYHDIQRPYQTPRPNAPSSPGR